MRLLRPKSLIVAFTAAVLLAVVLFESIGLWMRHERVIQFTETRASNLSLALSEYVRGAFVSADAALRQLAAYGQIIGGPEASPDDWMPILEAAKAALNESGSISVTNANGIVRRSTLRSILGHRRGDTYLFKHLSANDPDAMIVDEPFQSPVVKDMFVMPVGRRIETPDGTFDGMVVAVINPEAFREFFRTVRVGSDGAISVLHPNGVVLFSEPSERNPLGERVPDHPVLHAARRTGGAGVLHQPLQPGGPELITAYRTLQTPDLVVAVSLGRDEALADWNEQLRNTVVEVGALAGVLSLLVLFLFRQVNARDRAEHELGELQRSESERLMRANARLGEALDRERHAREESDAAGRLKDEFLMTLSHELRTPLNAIVGWLRMLTTRTLAPDQQQRALETIERNANAQARLIEDLLDVSRAISGKLHLQTKPIDVADAVLGATETLRPAMEARRIRFTSEVEAGLQPILADPDRLQQIVWNLLSNAIKFTPPGGSVTLRVAPVSDGIEIVVSDTGSGIPPAFLPYVFDRFRQADAGLRREQGGLGLGLAIVRHLVELHGGTITADSAGPDRGATFRVVLPTAGVPA